MITGIQTVYDERAKLVTQMQDISVAAAKEGRAMTADEVIKFEKIDVDQEAFTKTIEAFNRAEEIAAKNAKKIDTVSGGIQWNATSTHQADSQEDYRRSFSQFIKRGVKSLSTDQRSMIEQRGTSTQISGTDGLGGFGVPDYWQAGIEKAMLDYSGIMQAADVIRTDGGNTLFFLTEDDTATLALLVAESGAFTVQDMTYAQKQLDAYKYGTLVKYSYELAQDNTYNLEGDLQASFASRFGRAINAAGTTGTGSSQPNGVVTASTVGKTAASTTVFTMPEVIDLIHSIDPAYRAGTKFGLMFSDGVLAFIKKMAAATGELRPLWQPSFVAGAPDRIDGFQYWINQAMSSTFTTGQKLILAGDFSKFKIRIAQDMRVLRLDELYANNGHVGFQAWMRMDSECLNTAAIKHLKLA